MVVRGAVLADPAYLAQVAAQPNPEAVGTLPVLLAGFALAVVPVVFWPIDRRYHRWLSVWGSRLVASAWEPDSATRCW